jgi:hypothetical protein
MTHVKDSLPYSSSSSQLTARDVRQQAMSPPPPFVSMMIVPGPRQYNFEERPDVVQILEAAIQIVEGSNRDSSNRRAITVLEPSQEDDGNDTATVAGPPHHESRQRSPPRQGPRDRPFQ